MREIFWLEKHRIGGRCGPFKINWSLTEMKQNGIDTILTLGESLCKPKEIAGADMNHLILPLPDTRFEQNYRIVGSSTFTFYRNGTDYD